MRLPGAAHCCPLYAGLDSRPVAPADLATAIAGRRASGPSVDDAPPLKGSVGSVCWPWTSRVRRREGRDRVVPVPLRRARPVGESVAIACKGFGVPRAIVYYLIRESTGVPAMAALLPVAKAHRLSSSP